MGVQVFFRGCLLLVGVALGATTRRHLWRAEPVPGRRRGELGAPTFHRAGRAAAAGRPAGPRGSAAIRQVAAGPRPAPRGRWQSGPAERPSGPSGRASGPGGRLPDLAGPPGWAASGDSVSGSWGSASLSWAQTGNLQQTQEPMRNRTCSLLIRCQRCRETAHCATP